ncbi:MAG: hypothetical protein RSH24_15110 [Flavobacterium sp.]
MFKKCKYKFEPNQISVYPRYALLYVFAFLGVALMIASVVLVFFVAEGFSMKFLLQILGVTGITSLAIFLIPGLMVTKTQIVFDLRKSEIIQKGLFGSKKPIRFNEVDSIINKNIGTQMGYFIELKEDRYGKGIFLHQNTDEFRTQVLPEIEHKVFSKTTFTPERKAEIASGKFEYYTFKDSKYHVHTNPFRQFGLGLIAVSLFFLATVYYYFFENSTDKKEIQYMLMSLGVLLILIGLCSKKAYFDPKNKELIFKFYGIAFTKYALSDFHNFSITRNTTNGMYNGTDVKLLFKKPDVKIKESFELRDFGKTKGIERFIDETRHIIEKIK